jgi:hypothetical protein
MTEVTTSQERRQAGAAYAASVAALLTPATGDRAAFEVASAEDASANLLTASEQLRVLTADGLAAEDPQEVAASEVQLLAGAALDLLVAAQMPEAEGENVRALAAEMPALNDLAELRAIIGAPQAYLTGATSMRSLLAAPSAQVRARSNSSAELTAAVHASLTGIRGEVVKAGAEVVEDLLLLDAALLGQAISLVGGDVAKKLDIDLAGITARVLKFVLAANDKLIALVGVNALTEAQKFLQQWVDQLQEGTLFPTLAEKVLGTNGIETEVRGWVEAYQGPEAGLVMARDQISVLAGQYAAKTRIIEKLLAGLALVKIAPPLVTPVGRIVVAVLYLGLLAYVIGSGYDHVDSDKIALLDRVEGVRGVSKRLLTSE